jgi:hypothetical protein
MYAIHRAKLPGKARAWRVRFTRRGKPYARGFHDSKYGGSKKALAAAMDLRDRTLARVAAYTKRQYCEVPKSHNTSGATGVHFLRSPTQPLGWWQARIKLPSGKSPTKSLSARKFGYNQAHKRAVEARAELVLLIDDAPHVYHPHAKRLEATQQRVGGHNR